MKTRTFVLGDIHGAYKALIQCFERSGFDYEYDRLIILGDICDGWPEVDKCIEEVLKIKNLIYVLGNHDSWALGWAKDDLRPMLWVQQGGYNTMKSYDKPEYGNVMPQRHIDLLEGAYLYYEEDGRLFVHGGVKSQVKVENHRIDFLLWDRELVQKSRRYSFKENKKDKPYVKNYKEVFVGHTTTEVFRKTVPLNFSNVWMLDTGAGWSGKLTIMDVETKEYWQSDWSDELYRESKGRQDYQGE